MPTIKKSQLTTLEHFITKEQSKHPGTTGEFSSLLNNLSFAIKVVTKEVRRAGINDILGLANKKNVHDEEVKKIDDFANEILIKIMGRCGLLALLASEENEDVILPDKKFGYGKYLFVFDPLDGSSNIDVNITVGTIFSFYKRIDEKLTGLATKKDLLQPGYKQIAAGYALYGSSTILVYSTGHGVNAFTYDPTVGEFILTNENIKIPKIGSYYSVNEGYYNSWSDNLKKYIDFIKTPSNDKTKPYIARYVGTGVADFHRTLIYGGIFMYPKDKKMPTGKLRLVYEANPLAMLVEQAGGKATDGEKRILDIMPKNIHQRTPLYIGSEKNILELQSFLQGNHPFLKK